jgi:aspartate/tyrosine/aromatic aminotransferase
MWYHALTLSIQMFAYSGMSKDEVIALREKHHIYCTLDGRISMAVSSIYTVIFHVTAETNYSCIVVA